MIRYTLKCAQDHRFESWFKNADAFDDLKAGGHVTCPVCGDSGVTKALMAPKVTTARKAATITAPVEPTKAPTPEAAKPPATTGPAPVPGPAPAAGPAPMSLSAPGPEVEAKLAELRKHIEKNSDYVGKDFAKEARAMHEGQTPDRAIHGEASLDEAKTLIEDGVAVTPLPFTPKQKQN